MASNSRFATDSASKPKPADDAPDASDTPPTVPPRQSTRIARPDTGSKTTAVGTEGASGAASTGATDVNSAGADTGATSPTAPRPAPAGATKPAVPKPAVTGPRKVRLSVARVDIWSVVKFSFLISFAIGIMIVVATASFWIILDGMNVFTSINDLLAEIAGEAGKIDILQWVTFERTVSLATIIGLIDVVVLTLLSTIFAFLYNLTASLVGGITVTLTDE